MDEMNRATQNFDVLNCMRKHGYITDALAVDMGIYRLSARIFDLRGMGYDITTTMCNGKNHRGHNCRYARYSLA